MNFVGVLAGAISSGCWYMRPVHGGHEDQLLRNVSVSSKWEGAGGKVPSVLEAVWP